MADFWWQSKNESRGMHWKAWEDLSKPKDCGGLGFKDIEAFNTALLGKQLWRMLTQPNSLMARVFQSRYYRKSTPLDALLGSRPSFAWRSIHSAQELLKQGARMMVGRGNAINIWKDRWLSEKPAVPIQNTRRIPPNQGNSISSLEYVSELLTSDGRDWNNELLSMICSEETRQEIEKIRPGGKETADTYTWDYSKTGRYTVKSGYWVEVQVIKKKNSPQLLDQPSLNPLFQMVWQSDTSPKIQHFPWKCLSNSLAVAGNLFHRHLGKEKTCLRCPAETETVNHLLFKCSFARLVWAISKVPAPVGGEWSDSVYENMFWCLNLHKADNSLGKEIPWIMWRLWKNRNSLVFNGQEMAALDLIQKVEEDVVEWKESRAVPEITNRDHRLHNGHEKKRWNKPPQEWVKCNSDGAWPKEGAKCGLGWVLRNQRGEVIWMGAKAIPKGKSAFEAELEALRWAFLMIGSFGYKKVIFETDSQQLIAWIKMESNPSLSCPRAQDIRNLSRAFDEVKVVYVSRDGNRVADGIAKMSLSLQNYESKLYSIVPDWIKSSVSDDLCNEY